MPGLGFWGWGGSGDHVLAPAHLPTSPSSVTPTETESLPVLLPEHHTQPGPPGGASPGTPPWSSPALGNFPSCSPAKCQRMMQTQHSDTETPECLSSNMRCRVNHALGEAVQHIQQLLKPLWAAGLLQHLVLSQPETIQLATSTPGERAGQHLVKPCLREVRSRRAPCGSCSWHSLSFRLICRRGDHHGKRRKQLLHRLSTEPDVFGRPAVS